MGKPTEVPGLGPDTPRAHAAARLLAARVSDVRREVAAAALLDHDGVHDLRVALRRLRAALQLFGGGGRRRLARALKPAQDALGAVRDPQVQARWLERGELPRADRDLLAREVARPLGKAARRLSRALDRLDDELLPRLLRTAAEERGRGRLGGRKVRARLARRVGAVTRAAARVARDPSPRDAHELRIEAKKLRYACELAAPALPAARALLDALPELQEELGALHDADVRVELLERLSTHGEHAARDAARALLVHVRSDRAGRAAALVATLARLRREGTLESARRSLARGAASNGRDHAGVSARR